jgi:hypothetical protein
MKLEVTISDFDSELLTLVATLAAQPIDRWRGVV